MQDLIESLELEEIKFLIGYKTCSVEIEEDMTFHGPTFTQFVLTLELQPLDYIMVVVSFELEFRVIVFDSKDECEKLALINSKNNKIFFVCFPLGANLKDLADHK